MGNESENEEPNATKGIISDLDKKKEEVFLFFLFLKLLSFSEHQPWCYALPFLVWITCYVVYVVA